MPTDTQKEIAELKKNLQALNDEVYRNNFNASQDFQKYSRFNTRFKVPVVSTNPTIGDVGDIVCVGTTLKICTVASLTAPTWVTVGTQT